MPSAPPTLSGFSYLHVLGSGGFADVFLYEQNMPRRQVAVKVLLSEFVNDQARRMFQSEANLMAQLSAHPSILTVFQASVAADGRPYLVMELCSSALGARYRSEPLAVTEALRIAVRIGSAVETAHRAGVLHRDLKPSNILMTAYGHPVLSDFGIASTLGELDRQSGVGMSIPWSAPEVLADETAGTVRSEVWSFAATVYSLLAGRSPFEIPGGANTSTDLIARISRAKVQPIGRDDVPATLERLLAEAMTRKPENRPASVLDLVHGFQTIETELGVAQTPAELVMDDWALGRVSDETDRTQVRPATGVSDAARTGRRRRHAQKSGATVVPAGWQGSEAAAVRTASSLATPTRRLHALGWALIASTAVVLALGITASVVLVRAATAGSIPTVSDIAATVTAGTVEFSWADPGVKSDDAYSLATREGDSSVQKSTTFVLEASPGSRVCLTVTVNRAGKQGEPSGEKCVDVPR
ncbi:serine/threonine-protein kinase [Glaciihabitans tibetensis]|uniref:serine/threonine-protein kinase n=1 Tax=Glaciihabitans tibetensis TaxID=1266600 RepID=UPI001FE2947B|nr:serine/threonine-protein kinase [Glaciihabitans tibetensis]